LKGVTIFISSPAFPDRTIVLEPHTCMGRKYQSSPGVWKPSPADEKPGSYRGRLRCNTGSLGALAGIQYSSWYHNGFSRQYSRRRDGRHCQWRHARLWRALPKYFHGTHHYYFQLFALDATLDLPPSADKAHVAASMKEHVVDSATLVGLCEGIKTESW